MRVNAPKCFIHIFTYIYILISLQLNLLSSCTSVIYTHNWSLEQRQQETDSALLERESRSLAERKLSVLMIYLELAFARIPINESHLEKQIQER